MIYFEQAAISRRELRDAGYCVRKVTLTLGWE